MEDFQKKFFYNTTYKVQALENTLPSQSKFSPLSLLHTLTLLLLRLKAFRDFDYWTKLAGYSFGNDKPSSILCRCFSNV